VVKFEMNPESESPGAARVEDVAQEAIDATAVKCSRDPDLDVEEELRVELRSRGINVDDQWFAEAAQSIRSGQPPAVGEHDGSVEDG
jgi:hypothetical protein